MAVAATWATAVATAIALAWQVVAVEINSHQIHIRNCTKLRGRKHAVVALLVMVVALVAMDGNGGGGSGGGGSGGNGSGGNGNGQVQGYLVVGHCRDT